MLHSWWVLKILVEMKEKSRGREVVVYGGGGIVAEAVDGAVEARGYLVGDWGGVYGGGGGFGG